MLNVFFGAIVAAIVWGSVTIIAIMATREAD